MRDENARLRKLVADLSLDKEALQSVIRKSGPELVAIEAAIGQINATRGMSGAGGPLLTRSSHLQFPDDPEQAPGRNVSVLATIAQIGNPRFRD